MNPRLKTSKKWTNFPTEYLGQIREVFQTAFKDHLVDAKLLIEGRIYTTEILLRVGVLQKGSLRQANFEVSMDFSQAKKNTVERLHDCIDGAASMMQEYFEFVPTEEATEPDFPVTWQEYEFNKQPLFFQFSTENSELEAKANELLGDLADDDSLVVELADDDEEVESEEDADKKATRH